MSNLSCNIVRDLLPLYCDRLLEQESIAEVKKHLEECNACREIYEKMNREISASYFLEKEKEVPDIQTLFRKIRIRNGIIFSILIMIIFFLSGSYWNVPANAVEVEEISISTIKDDFSEEVYFNFDYRADGIEEFDVNVYQQGDTIRIEGKRSLFSVIKSNGSSVQVGGGAGCQIENVESIKQVYFNGRLIWDVDNDGEIPRK